MPEPKVPADARLDALERRARDLEAQRLRERDEQKRDYATMLESAKKALEEAIARSEPMSAQIAELLRVNYAQYALLEGAAAQAKESAEERVRRSERDRIAAEEKQRADTAKQLRAETLERQLKIGALLIALITALGGAFGACQVTRNIGGGHDNAPSHAP